MKRRSIIVLSPVIARVMRERLPDLWDAWRRQFSAPLEGDTNGAERSVPFRAADDIRRGDTMPDGPAARRPVPGAMPERPDEPVSESIPRTHPISEDAKQRTRADVMREYRADMAFIHDLEAEMEKNQ